MRFTAGHHGCAMPSAGMAEMSAQFHMPGPGRQQLAVRPVLTPGSDPAEYMLLAPVK
jgi:hypothetical protein